MIIDYIYRRMKFIASAAIECIRGTCHHVYNAIWTPVIGECLKLCREPGNVHDRRAVCIKKGGAIVGLYHVN